MLLNLLAQNPALHVTPTNDLSELAAHVRDRWSELVAFKAQGFKEIAPRIRTALSGMIRGFYAEENELGKTIIDKSRAWLAQIELLEEVLERKIKIIVPIRSVEDVLASLEKLHRRATLTVPPYSGPLLALRQTTIGRAQSYLAPEAVLGLVIARLRDALQRGFKNRLLIVPFKEFTARPLDTVRWLESELELPHHDYDVNDVRQVTHENDDFYGIDLHRIREGKIESQPNSCWRGILPDELVNWVQQEYKDINDLAYRRLPREEFANGRR